VINVGNGRRKDGGLGAITLDIDGVRHYHAIHGLHADGSHHDPPIEKGVRRFLRLCDELDVKSTLFVVTKDLEDESSGLRELVGRAAKDGHEIASHSHTHAYDLSTSPPTAIEADLMRSVDALAKITGRAPRGFRAPGDNLSEALLDAVQQAGVAYDSRLMPSPLYWAARALAIGAHRITGRRSSAIVGDRHGFAAVRATPRAPYRPRHGALHQRARSRSDGRELVEVPIATLPLGLPWLGTTVGLAPLLVGVASTALALSSPEPCVLELHAIDLCDEGDGFAPALVRVQRELAVPLHRKLHRLEAALRMMVQVRDVVTVAEIAAHAS
jgi:hypothetical protein